MLDRLRITLASVSLIFAFGITLTSCRANQKSVIDQCKENLSTEIRVAGRLKLEVFSLEQRMKFYKIPGVSIAVVDKGRIVWAQGFGTTESGGNNPITTETLFQAGSISKPITATVMLNLVGNGLLDLDEPVNTYLHSWTLPDNQFTRRKPVSLRRIASHSAGVTVSGFPGYNRDEQIPTLIDILNGTGSANTPEIRVNTTPGSLWRYSGGGVTIEQLVMTDISGESFPDLMDLVLFNPLGMKHSTFKQHLPREFESKIAVGHKSNGEVVPGRYHVYPEMAAAGLWSTPTDLMRWALEIDAALEGRSDQVISQELAHEMLTIQKATSGIGLFVRGNRGTSYFIHGGVTSGFVSRVIYLTETNQGAAIMTNGNGAVLDLTDEILLSIADVYDWPPFSEVVAVSASSSVLEGIIDTYVAKDSEAQKLTISKEGSRLIASINEPILQLGMREKEEIVLTAPNVMIGLRTGSEYTFNASSDGVFNHMRAFGLTWMRQ